MTALATVQRAAAGRGAITLEAVLDTARLQTRMDTKYLLTPAQFATLADDLGDRFCCLDIDGRRLHRYESVYFDTPDLATFTAHRQGRRRRFKVRTRTYADTAECLFEVKLEGFRGSTVKERLDYRHEDRAMLAPDAAGFLARALEEYGVDPPVGLRPSLVTRYRRATLVDPVEGARLTLDVGLEFLGPEGLRRGPDRVLVESKSAGGAAADRALAARGVRPVSASKYCLGLALTRPGLAANRWSRLLRREFGWSRVA